MRTNKMRTVMRKQLIILILVIVTGLKGQKNIDSLKIVLKTTTNDTVKCNILSNLIEYASDNVLLDYSNEIIKICEMNLRVSDLKPTQRFFKIKIAYAYTNLASYALSKANYAAAMNYLSKALKIEEQIKDKKGMANTTIVKGDVCEKAGEFDYAANHFKKAYEISLEIKDKETVANCLSRLGSLFYKNGGYDTALVYFLKAKIIYDELHNDKFTGINERLGFLYRKKLDYDKAMEYFKISLQSRESVRDTAGMSFDAQCIAHTLVLKKDFINALPYAKKAHDYALIEKQPVLIMHAANTLRKVYTNLNQPAKALELYEVYIKAKDSVDSESNRKIVIKNHLQSEYEIKTAKDSLRADEERKIATLEIEKQQTQKTGLYIGLVFVLIFAGIIFNRFRVTQKQKAVIENHQKDILDSITYAKRLQQAILPSESLIKQHLPDSFVLYKPKDIVAGDFYWLEKVGDLVLFAAADCTGHGVPGALVSVVCSNALNRAVLEFGITEPGKILDKTRELVIATFEKSGEEIKDGMDISICCLNEKTNEVSWAGANNPLWVYNSFTKEIDEIKADKQPVGKYAENKPFNTRTAQLVSGDILYLFTDGFADQFGGPKGKKFMYKKMKELLLSNSNGRMLMSTQKEILDGCFNSWKGDLEQVDDVCVIGVKI